MGNAMSFDEFQLMLKHGPDAEKDMVQAMILAALGKLGGAAASEDDLLFKGKKFILPAQFEGDIQGAVSYLRNLDEQLNTVHAFRRTFRYRPDDVAHALGVAMKKIFGTTGIGKETVGFFGSVTPPTFRTVNTGFNETAQVIQGKTEFPPLGAVITVHYDQDAEVGMLGHLIIEAPRRFRAQAEGLFLAVEDVLKTASIYRGKAVNGSDTPGFLNTGLIDPRRVIYTADVMDQLDANLWTPIRHTDVLREMGMPLKRAVLLEGPYGTGKSMAAALTARICEENSWTFVQVRPGDDLELAMKTARLYEPAVVFYEDVDTVTENGEPAHVSRLLDIFDGIAAKGADVIVVMTTNHVDKIQKGMLRPGRMDSVIHIGAMEPDGFRKLIEVNVPEGMLMNIDYDEVGKAFDGFLPAFAMEAINRAMRYGVSRSKGKPDFLTTHDFVAAADGLRPQLARMNEATEGVRLPNVDKALRDMVQDAIHKSEFVNNDPDEKIDDADVYYRLRKPKVKLNGEQ
jgi:transitional endoplasmic reticulum ATPase